MKRLLSLAVFMLGCASVPPNQLEDQQLCNRFAHRDDGGLINQKSSETRRALYEEATSRKGLISPAFKGAVIAHDIRIGMRYYDVLCSWGNPDHGNTTRTASGDSEQWVYDRCYVYLKNGIVTAVQN